MAAHPYRTAWEHQGEEERVVDALDMPIMFARVGLLMWSIARVAAAVICGWDIEAVIGFVVVVVLLRATRAS
jgi:hypothetical protein